MELGIDSFAAQFKGKNNTTQDNMRAMQQLLQRIEHADRVGLDVFGIGEHHRKEFLDAATAEILAAAAAKTKNIKLTSAVTVLSAADPVRVFQSFATLDLISNGRAEIVTGRGSSIEAFPLFGYDLSLYDELFVEKLHLLLKIRDNEFVTWKGKYRPEMHNQPVYPRPVQNPLPIWIGVGGTPESFIRAGSLGLPLMVAIIGGETHRFRPLVDLYREAGRKAGFKPGQLKVGLHSLGYVAETTEKAIEDFYPGFEESMNAIGRERGWAMMTRERFMAQNGFTGAYLVGNPEEVAEKILRHSQALGGVSRVTFQMDTGGLSHVQLMNAIELLGKRVKPLISSVP